MDISRIPAGLPPGAREEFNQRLQNGRGGDVGGNPTSAERQASAERGAAARQAAQVQTATAVDRTARPDLAEPAREPLAMRPANERGARLDLRV